MTNSIQFQDKFNSLAKAVDMQPDEEAIAKFFWYAGLRHAFQRGTSSAALLQPKPATSPLHETQPEPFKWNFPSKPALPSKAPATFSNDTSVYKGYTSELSPYEAKLISLLLTEVLRNGTEGAKLLESQVNSMWKHCDKDDEATEEIFKEMNRGKGMVQRLKSQLNSLAQAQRTLKKISKGL